MFQTTRVLKVSVSGKEVCFQGKGNGVTLRIFSLLTFQCKVGWAGDGRICGTDSDLDSWPDMNLPCSNPRCRKVC